MHIPLLFVLGDYKPQRLSLHWLPPSSPAKTELTVYGRKWKVMYCL